MLEQRYGIGENLLINAVQFQRQSLRPEEQVFAGQTIAMSGEIAERVRFGELWDWRTLRVWGGAAAAVLVLWFAFIVVFPRQFGAAVERYALPLADTPPPGSVVLKLTPDADVTVPEGGNLDVALEVSTPGNQPLAKPPVIVWQERANFIQPVQSAGENIAMTPGENKFVHTFANLQTPFSFRVFAGDSFSRSISGEGAAAAAIEGRTVSHHAAGLHRIETAGSVRPARAGQRAAGFGSGNFFQDGAGHRIGDRERGWTNYFT